ncbi:MAG: fibronectin type III domain-containing protein [Bellilinea sp.]
MIKRTLILSLIAAMLAAPMLSIRAAVAEPVGEFYASPGSVMPGAEVVFSGFGFLPDSSVELYLQTLPSQYLGMLATDSAGQFSGALPLPVVAAGNYQVMAVPYDVLTDIAVLPAMTLDLLPNSGSPGTIVHFAVNNLAAGQLRLDYAGIPIYGPVDVSAGIFEGDFLVPADRPNSFPQDVPVIAFNTIGNQTIGSAITYFVAESQDWPIFSSPPYSILITEVPPNPVAPGYPFTFQGTISPPPQGPLNLYELKLLWKSASGQIVPITDGTPQLLSNGSFTITGHAPSLLGGDPLLPGFETGGSVGVIFIDKNNGGNSTAGFAPWLNPPYPVFKVKVVDENGSPIQGAIVDVRAFYASLKTISGETSGEKVMQNQLNNLEMHPNQIINFLNLYTPSQSDPFSCELTNTYGRTDENGIFEVKIDPEMLSLLGSKTYIKNGNQSGYMEYPLDIDFPLYVNATFQGFGNKGLPEPYTLAIHFSGTTHWFYDAAKNTKLDTDPLIVSLKSLPAGTKITVPIVPKVKDPSTIHDAAVVLGGFKNYLGLNIPMTAFGNLYSFPLSQFPDAWFTGSGNIDIEFEYDPALFGPLDEDNITFTLEGHTYPFYFYYKKSGGQQGCEIVKYRATIPQAHRLSPGNHTGLIEIRDNATVPNITKHYIQLNYISPPTWILDAKYKAREINLFGTSIVMHGYQFPAGAPNSTSNLDTDVPKIGPLANNVSFQDDVEQSLYPDHTSGITYAGRSDSTVVDEDVVPPKYYNSSVAGGNEISIPEETVTVLDTGKIPLYRHVIGIYPIAGATLGADMWIDATLTTSGLIKFLPGGGTSTNMLVFPKATIGVDAFLDASVLFGLISASAHALPNIGLGMPASFVDGTLSDSKRCFLYQLTLSWTAKTGICPLCLSYSDSEELFNGSNPSPCTVPSTASASLAESYVTATTAQPPTSSPSIAVDGFGHTLLVWSDANNNIQSRLMSGGQTVGDFAVSSTMGGIDPQVAFYAPNKAVAVWTESSLGSSQNATLEQALQAQHLKYALWNGNSWGAPQNLTLPAASNGEGKVVLAGCPSTQANCPAGGGVTAVWVRDMGAAYSERNFRLFYAAFNGGVWGSAAAVDPASTGTDAEAAVAYSPTGAAQVVWMRDADRSLSTVTDRLIYHRQLASESPVTALTGLPASAVEPSLAVNAAGEMILAFTVATDPTAFMGNQRQLHAAKQTCGGGGCTWAYSALVDSNNRPVHAESPALTLNSNGQAQITYRALGFGEGYSGGPTVLPGDPLGTVIGTGEIAQALVTVSGANLATITPSYQTSSGNTVWQTTAVYDPLFNQTYAVGSQGSGPALSQQALSALEAMGYSVDGLAVAEDPLVFAVTSSTPDFSITDVIPSTVYPQPEGEPLIILVTVLNNGPSFTSGREMGNLVVKLAWDAPVGLGTPAGEVVIPFIDAGTLTGIEFSADPAAGTLTPPTFPHLPHTLYVQVNPAQTIAESDFQNNSYSMEIGGLPTPQKLAGAAEPGDSSVFLEWLPVEHSSVKGYRVYRSSDGRDYAPVGSTFIPGFVDLSGVIGQTYQYRVTAFAEDGFESALSEPIQATVGVVYPVYLPLVNR